MKKLAIYAVHPIMYQTPIFREFNDYVNKNKIKINLSVYFGDDLSLKEVYFKEINTLYKPNVPFLLNGYEHKFLRNWSKEPRSGFFSRINFGVFKELRKNKFDAILIHGYDTFSAWLTLLAAKIYQSKIIYRGESVLRGNENSFHPKQLLKKIVVRFFLNNCDAVMFSCTGNKNFLIRYGVRSDKLFSIPCAVNNNYFQKEAEKYSNQKKEIRSELGIPEGDLVLLFSARFTSRKRPMDLLAAVKNINRKNLTILFVGDGPEKKKMEEFSIKNDINAVFIGFVNQDTISKYYSVADVNIVVSDYDPSPKAMNEAMNFKLPIITTNVVGTAHDLVEEGVNGFIIDVGDTYQLSKHISILLENRSLVKIMGENSLNKVKEWNYKSDVIGIIEAFESITDAKI